jgi:hypothetical protein
VNVRRQLTISAIGIAAMVLVTACVGPTGAEITGPDRTTSPATASTLVITASGDIGSTAESSATLGRILELGADLHVALGDLSYGETGEEQAWCDFVTDRVGQEFPFQLLAGNHESDGLNGDIDAFAECLPDRVGGLVGEYAREYYVDVPAEAPLARLVMISPGISYPDGTWSYEYGTGHSEWTRQAIVGAGDAGIRWVIVGMHKPCLSVGNYECDSGPEIADLLVEAGADLVIGGHEHLYQRSVQLGIDDTCRSSAPAAIPAACIVDDDDALERRAGTVFVTVGTGGTPLREVHPDDPVAPFFATWSGANAEPTWGNLRVTISEAAMDVEFLPAVGVFTDRFRISD